MQSFKPEEAYRRPKKSNLKPFLKETGLFIVDIFYNAVIIIILVVLIRSFLISPFRVVGSSMADTLSNKEFILIDKLSYLIGDVKRGDPIVFLPPATSKDKPKFEEMVTAGAQGQAMFDFSGLSREKDAVYCRNPIFKALWFCREGVEAGDVIYYAPQEDLEGSLARQTNWGTVMREDLNAMAADRGFLEFEAAPDTTYTVRVYDSEGPDYFVKRVIGLPGDTVKIDGGRVYLKGPDDADFWQIDESFLNGENLNRTYISQRQRQNVYVVPEGHYFVMGDNRNHSNDSRSWLEPITQDSNPFVPEANISGKVLVVLWPVTDLRLIHSADYR